MEIKKYEIKHHKYICSNLIVIKNSNTLNLWFDLPFHPLCREDQLILLLLGALEDPEGPIKHNNRYKTLDMV